MDFSDIKITDFSFSIFLGLLLIAVIYLANMLRIYLTKKSTEIYKKNETMRKIDKLKGVEFEKWVQGLFTHIGADAMYTPASGDHGIDVKVNYKGLYIGVQCKRYEYYEVGERDLRDLYGSQRHFRYDRVILITSGNFTRQALSWAKGKKDLILINRQLLGDIIVDKSKLIRLLK